MLLMVIWFDVSSCNHVSVIARISMLLIYFYINDLFFTDLAFNRLSATDFGRAIAWIVSGALAIVIMFVRTDRC